jgi:UPF0716 protein FxsA
MSALVALLFLVVPLVELFLIVQVAGTVGAWNTIALLVLISIAGTLLIRWQGIELARRLMTTVRQGRLPRFELVDGALLVVAGALLLTPGFLSDLVGVLLLLPPVRALLRPMALDAVRRMATPRTGSRVRVWTSVVDVDEVRPDQPSAGSRPVLDIGAHERRTEPDGR